MGERSLVFSLDAGQLSKLDIFKNEHGCKLSNDSITGRKKVGAIGGQYTYSFTNTTIGTVAKVRCACGAEIDLSDYENW